MRVLLIGLTALIMGSLHAQNAKESIVQDSAKAYVLVDDTSNSVTTTENQVVDYSNAVVFVSENEFENEDKQYKEDKEEVVSVNKRFETAEPQALPDDSNTDLNDEGYDLSDER